MVITWHGHSEFLLVSDRREGVRLLTDPFDASVGYPYRKTECELCTVSHGHHDHNDLSKVPHDCRILDSPGIYTPYDGVSVRTVESFHDDAHGEKRGKNLIMIITMDGLVAAHLGDLGHVPDEETVRQIGPVDLLFIPVGGHFTIDAKQASQTCEKIAPRVIFPMHYKTAVNAGWPIAELEPFLTEMRATPREREPMPLVRVTKEDLSEQKRICVLSVYPQQ